MLRPRPYDSLPLIEAALLVIGCGLGLNTAQSTRLRLRSPTWPQRGRGRPRAWSTPPAWSAQRSAERSSARSLRCSPAAAAKCSARRQRSPSSAATRSIQLQNAKRLMSGDFEPRPPRPARRPLPWPERTPRSAFTAVASYVQPVHLLDRIARARSGAGRHQAIDLGEIRFDLSGFVLLGFCAQTSATGNALGACRFHLKSTRTASWMGTFWRSADCLREGAGPAP